MAKDRLTLRIKTGMDNVEELTFKYIPKGETEAATFSLDSATRATLRLVDEDGDQVGKLIDSDDAGFGAGQPFDASIGSGIMWLRLGPYVESLTDDDAIPAGTYRGQLTLFGTFLSVAYTNGLNWTMDAQVIVEPSPLGSA